MGNPSNATSGAKAVFSAIAIAALKRCATQKQKRRCRLTVWPIEDGIGLEWATRPQRPNSILKNDPCLPSAPEGARNFKDGGIAKAMPRYETEFFAVFYLLSFI